MYVAIDTKDFLAQADALGAAADQMAFIMSLSLNRAVKDTRAYLIERTWPGAIKQRNPSFIRAALHTEFSSKHNLTVSIVDQLGRGSLKAHAEGGIKQPRGKALAVPSRNVKVGAHGVPKAQRPRNLRQAFVKDGKIYQAQGQGKGKRLRVMFYLKPAVKIPQDVPFYKDFGDQMHAALTRELPGAVTKAMATRKPR